MAKRKQPQEESFETAEGFQIEDIEGNAVIDETLEDDTVLENGSDAFWDEDEDDEEEQEEDEYFNSVAEENNWEEGYDY